MSFYLSLHQHTKTQDNQHHRRSDYMWVTMDSVSLCWCVLMSSSEPTAEPNPNAINQNTRCTQIWHQWLPPLPQVDSSYDRTHYFAHFSSLSLIITFLWRVVNVFHSRSCQLPFALVSVPKQTLLFGTRIEAELRECTAWLQE